MTPTLSPALQRLISCLGAGREITAGTFQEALTRSKYTGFIGLHCINGRVQQIDLGAPIRYTIVEALDKPANDRTGSRP